MRGERAAALRPPNSLHHMAVGGAAGTSRAAEPPAALPVCPASQVLPSAAPLRPLPALLAAQRERHSGPAPGPAAPWECARGPAHRRQRLVLCRRPPERSSGVPPLAGGAGQVSGAGQAPAARGGLPPAAGSTALWRLGGTAGRQPRQCRPGVHVQPAGCGRPSRSSAPSALPPCSADTHSCTAAPWTRKQLPPRWHGQRRWAVAPPSWALRLRRGAGRRTSLGAGGWAGTRQRRLCGRHRRRGRPAALSAAVGVTAQQMPPAAVSSSLFSQVCSPANHIVSRYMSILFNP